MKTKERKNYKQIFLWTEMIKRGQITIFVLIALVIVALAALLYFLVPDIRVIFTGDIVPSNYLKGVLDEEIENSVNKLSLQGGYENPEGAILYQGQNIKYLCYTSKYYEPCKVQQPLIKSRFEQELARMIQSKAVEGAERMKEEYRSRGFTVTSAEEIDTGVLIVPEKIVVSINAPTTIEKEGRTQSFNEFEFELESKMYDLLMIATSIIDYESTYGDSEISFYTQYYPNLIIHKNKLGDGSTIYKLRDVTGDDEFTFASRSLAWPGGYGTE